MPHAHNNTSSATGRRLLAGLALVVVAGLAIVGWRWQAGVPVERVDVNGAHHASADTLEALARVDIGSPLFDIDPAFIEDRVQRHPWVRSAHAMRLPTGTLRISVEEREPVALLLDDNGAPGFYFDASGFQMPVVEGAVYDVPLITGVSPAYQPLQPVEEEPIATLLRLLPESPAGELISELAIDGHEVTAYTLASDPHGVIPIRLGHEPYDLKLEQLHAFWERAVRTQPEKVFEMIDLRFEGQVVTREEMRNIE